MRFFLARNTHIDLGKGVLDGRGLIVRETYLKVDILPTGNPKHLNQDDCDKLKNLLQNTVFFQTGQSKALPEKPATSNQDEKSQFDWELKVSLAVLNKDGEWKDAVVSISNPLPRRLFEKLDQFAKAYNRDLKLNAIFRNLKIFANSVEYKTDLVRISDMTLALPEADSDFTFTNGDIGIIGGKGVNYWGTVSYSFECDLDMELMLTKYTKLEGINNVITNNQPTTNGQDTNENSTVATKSILQKEVACDLKIVSSEGKAVGCHKAFLLVHSQAFPTIYKDVFEDSKPGTIQMPDMTETSVRALLDYLYLNDLHAALNNAVITFELYQAGYKYKISNLEEQMKRLLLTKPNEWFCSDVALRLYIFTRNVVGSDELKKRADELIKLYLGQLTTK